MRNATWKGARLAVTIAALAVLSATATLAQGKKGGGSTPPPPTIRYSFQALGTLEGGGSHADGLNNHGDVVGRSDGHAYLSTVVDDVRTMIDLNDWLSEEDKVLWRNLNIAYAINDAGQIVGEGHVWGDPLTKAFRLMPAYTDDSGDHPAAIEFLSAAMNPKGINIWGDVTGVYETPDGYRAFVQSDGAPESLGVLYAEHNYSQGTAINAFGQVAGFSAVNPGPHTAILFTPGLGMQDLGVIKAERNGTKLSLAYDLNNAGDVVGVASAGGLSRRAFRWREGVMKDLGTLGGTSSSASGVSQFGHVVGSSQSKVSHQRPFLYQDEFGMVDVETLVVDLPAEYLNQLSVTKINDAGQIIGNVGGTGFILTPLP